jgi:tetratricopeptide (TPR) repeat protein
VDADRGRFEKPLHPMLGSEPAAEIPRDGSAIAYPFPHPMLKKLMNRLLGKPTPESPVAAPGREPEVALVTLRTLEIARRFPQELPDAPSLERGKAHTCSSCGSPLAPVILTTGGPYADPAVWQAYPIAIDGWQCQGCKDLSYPAFLSPGEMTALLDAAVAAAQAGAFDDAELALRRAVASWPAYMPARMNFGAMLLDRIRVERQQQNRQERIDAYADQAEAQLRRALSAEPPAPPPAYFMLGKLLHRRGKPDAADVLRRFLAMAGAPPPLRAEAQALLGERAS